MSKNWRLGFGGVLCILEILMGWGCCQKSPPVTSPPAATMILENMHTAAWMPMDNGFVSSPGAHSVCKAASATDEQKFGRCAGHYTDPHVELRTGVILQIGQLEESGGLTDNFDNVLLTRSGGSPVTLDETMFDWLDVKPVDTVCVIDALHAYSLFQGASAIVTTECDGASLVPVLTPASCLRARGIQAGLHPDTAIITYWSGASDFKVERAAGGRPFKYTFSLNDAITVDRWLAGCFQERYENVTEIRIRYPQDSQQHAGFPHPPMDGGLISVGP